MPPPEVPEPYQLKVKAWTAVVTAATLAGLLLFDWDKATPGQVRAMGADGIWSSGTVALLAARRQLESGRE